MSVPTPASEAQRWLRFAQYDLTAAESIATGDLASHICCYHAQQSVEKALKAILVFLQLQVPFVHDLDAIRNLIPAGWHVLNRHPSLAFLSGWAVRGRYPGNWPEATDQDAQVAASQARAVWETVLNDLDAHGLDVSAFR